jgi:uncharacterized protein
MTEPDPAVSLFEAIAAADEDRARAALASGASPDGRDDDDWSPLDRAAGKGDTAMVRLLLDAGADPRSTGREQRTSYRIALAAGRLDAARLLRAALEAADPSTVADHRWTPYCRAYPVSRLRAFEGWPDLGGDLDDDAVVYLHDDLTVTREMWHGEEILLAEVSDAWRRYCTEQLAFRVPDDFDLVPGQNSGVI